MSGINEIKMDEISLKGIFISLIHNQNYRKIF